MDGADFHRGGGVLDEIQVVTSPNRPPSLLHTGSPRMKLVFDDVGASPQHLPSPPSSHVRYPPDTRTSQNDTYTRYPPETNNDGYDASMQRRYLPSPYDDADANEPYGRKNVPYMSAEDMSLTARTAATDATLGGPCEEGLGGIGCDHLSSRSDHPRDGAPKPQGDRRDATPTGNKSMSGVPEKTRKRTKEVKSRFMNSQQPRDKSAPRSRTPVSRDARPSTARAITPTARALNSSTRAQTAARGSSVTPTSTKRELSKRPTPRSTGKTSPGHISPPSQTQSQSQTQTQSHPHSQPGQTHTTSRDESGLSSAALAFYRKGSPTANSQAGKRQNTPQSKASSGGTHVRSQQNRKNVTALLSQLDLWNIRLQQWRFICARANHSFRIQEKSAMRQLNGLWNDIRDTRERVYSLKKETLTQYYLLALQSVVSEEKSRLHGVKSGLSRSAAAELQLFDALRGTLHGVGLMHAVADPQELRECLQQVDDTLQSLLNCLRPHMAPVSEASQAVRGMCSGVRSALESLHNSSQRVRNARLAVAEERELLGHLSFVGEELERLRSLYNLR